MVLQRGADGKILRNGNALVRYVDTCCCGDDCDRRLFITWESEPVNGNPIIQEGSSPVFTHTTTIVQSGVSVEVEIDAELIGLPECISQGFNEDLPFEIRSTLVSNPAHTDQFILGNVDPFTQTGDAETRIASSVASPVNDYSGRAFVRFVHPDFSPVRRVFAVEWSYVAD